VHGDATVRHTASSRRDDGGASPARTCSEAVPSARGGDEIAASTCAGDDHSVEHRRATQPAIALSARRRGSTQRAPRGEWRVAVAVPRRVHGDATVRHTASSRRDDGGASPARTCSEAVPSARGGDEIAASTCAGDEHSVEHRERRGPSAHVLRGCAQRETA
jgi:hypothetical protein